jgi:hypothetical protein
MLTEQERVERHREANYAWKKRHPEVHQAYKRRYYGKTSFALKHGESWTSEEDTFILGHWTDRDMTDHEISEMLGRSVGAIQVRRWRLKLASV